MSRETTCRHASELPQAINISSLEYSLSSAIFKREKYYLNCRSSLYKHGNQTYLNADMHFIETCGHILESQIVNSFGDANIKMKNRLRSSCKFFKNALKTTKIETTLVVTRSEERINTLRLGRVVKRERVKGRLSNQKVIINIGEITLPEDWKVIAMQEPSLTSALISSGDGSNIVVCCNVQTKKLRLWACWCFSLATREATLIKHGKNAEVFCKSIPGMRNSFVICLFDKQETTMTVTDFRIVRNGCIYDAENSQILSLNSNKKRAKNPDNVECTISEVATSSDGSKTFCCRIFHEISRCDVWKISRTKDTKTKWSPTNVCMKLPYKFVNLGYSWFEDDILKCQITWFEEIVNCRMFNVCQTFVNICDGTSENSFIDYNAKFTGVIVDHKQYKPRITPMQNAKLLTSSNNYGTNIITSATTLSNNRTLYAILNTDVYGGMEMQWVVSESGTRLRHSMLTATTMSTQIWANSKT